jgi:DNA-3-methyladenine glycosylase
VRHREDGEEPLVLRLVETEAYLGEGDLASHASNGPATERARKLFRPPGMAYVYLIYGMHHCLNAVTGSEDDGSAVLVRAGAPVMGASAIAEMLRRRSWEGKRVRPGDVAGGPGKLCQALGIDGAFDGRPLWEGELVVTEGEPVADREVATGPRIGVDYAGEAAGWPLRYGVRGEREMSRPVLG